jgi:vancomycin aglycone glucosyltransferase
MRVLLSTYGSRGNVEPRVGPAVQLQALGAEVRCAPELVAAQFDTAAAAAEGRDAPAATGVMPAGVRL